MVQLDAVHLRGEQQPGRVTAGTRNPMSLLPGSHAYHIMSRNHVDDTFERMLVLAAAVRHNGTRTWSHGSGPHATGTVHLPG